MAQEAVVRVANSKRLGTQPVIFNSYYGPNANMEPIMRARAHHAGKDGFMGCAR
jgi:hypothetical protein